ncbi:hypothetical protein LINPERHAP2_LOCUS5556 [Linum perenne]
MMQRVLPSVFVCLIVGKRATQRDLIPSLPTQRFGQIRWVPGSRELRLLFMLIPLPLSFRYKRCMMWLVSLSLIPVVRIVQRPTRVIFS